MTSEQNRRHVLREQPQAEEPCALVLSGWFQEAPWWAISAVLHLILLLLLGGLVLAVQQSEATPTDRLLIRSRPYPEETPRHDLPTAFEDTSNVFALENRLKHIEQTKPRPVIEVHIPKGQSLDNLSDKHLDHKDCVDVVGLGGGAAGWFGLRTGIGTLSQDGGAGTISAIRLALEWLCRHQNPDGSWSCHDFLARCDKTRGSCRIHAGNSVPWGREGRGWKEHDIGVTALAVLAFTGFGQTHQFGRKMFVPVVRKAAEFLKKVQIRGTGDPRYDGCFRSLDTIPTDAATEARMDEEQAWMYDHAIATMAVAELLALSGDTIGLQRCVEDAAGFCLRAQAPGSGWRYSVKSTVPDTSVTGWMVLALKAVKACHIFRFISCPQEEELEAAFRGALTWFDRATSEATGVTGYRAPGDQGSMLTELAEVSGGYPYSKEPSCMTAVSVLCRLFAGQRRSSPVIKRGVSVLMRHLPRWRHHRGKALSTINFYYWYYATLAMFQYGGAPWAAWNQAMRTAVLYTQRVAKDSPNGCEIGSWDPVGEWSRAGGRVYATAMGALTLEVYWRFKRTEESSVCLFGNQKPLVDKTAIRR